MSKLISKKNLIVGLAVSLVLIIAGAVVFGLLGFAKDSAVQDKTSVEVSGYLSLLTDEERDTLTGHCKEYIEGEGYSVLAVNYRSETSGFNDACEFVIAAEADAYTEEQLQALTDGLSASIAALGTDEIANIGAITQFGIPVSYVQTVNNFYSQYAWRAAVAGAVVLVIACVYAAIRFRPGMGVAVLVAGVHDVLLTLALVALFRIPMGVTLLAVAAFSLLVSLFFNLYVFGRMRGDLRDEAMKDVPAQEAVAASVKGSKRNVFGFAVALAVAVVLVGVIGTLLGADLAFAMVGGLLALIVSVYSSLLVAPSLFAGIKAGSDKRRAERSRYDYVSAKERKKREKAVAEQQPASME